MQFEVDLTTGWAYVSRNPELKELKSEIPGEEQRCANKLRESCGQSRIGMSS